MVCRPFVAERRWNGFVHHEAGVDESEAELRQRLGPLMAAVRHRHQIGNGQVALAVGRIRRRRYRGGIGRPHRRGGHCGGSEPGSGLARIGGQTGEPDTVGPSMRQENALAQAERDVGAHFGDAFQGGRTGV